MRVQAFPNYYTMALMLFVYMFITSIVLVNLLIAQMGERYAEIMAEADQVRCAEICHRDVQTWC